MPNTKPKTPVAAKPVPQPAINDSDMDFHNGQLDGVKHESDRVKKIMDQRYKDLVTAFNKEVNIATRYELKLRIDELQSTYDLLFLKGE